MGVFRKLTSMGTFGLVDFRSDKERIARNTRRTVKELRKQTKLMKEARKRGR
ncbi:hypothetical protein ACIPYS_08790 [Kitasatospora sp. NPDC089913]|uniref:hypothetical protein n=1 Tax=Streptomycetaceae TaxID=2062 RepID=UPI0008792986|nr:hypothetical protein [Streptomyces sp. TLI_053]SDS69430.1 hypothetical protein SAMN05216371_0427 [Streptomyces sp. TLI_053]